MEPSYQNLSQLEIFPAVRDSHAGRLAYLLQVDKNEDIQVQLRALAEGESRGIHVESRAPAYKFSAPRSFPLTFSTNLPLSAL